MDFILKLFINPTTWIVIALCGAFLYMNNLSTSNAKLQATTAAQVQVIEAQQTTIQIQQSDMKSINDLMSKKQTIVVQQKATNDKLAQIKDTSTNHPFINPELLAAANVMRDSQTSSINPASDNSN